MWRPGSLTVALAACIAAATAGVACGSTSLEGDPPPPVATQPPAASSTALPVSRRSEPSIDRYTRSAEAITPLAKMTSAQQWISSRARPFVAHDSDATVSRNLLGWATKPDVHAYVNATGVNLYNPEGQRDAAKWLVKRGRTSVHVDSWSMLDVRIPEARRWWLYGTDGKASCTANRNRRAALDLIACGYTGLWIDNILTAPAQWFKPDPKIAAGPWGEGIVALLTELRAALPAAVPFTINAHWTDVDFPYTPVPTLAAGTPFLRAAALADQLVIEGGAIDPGIDYAGPVEAAWSYPRLLHYVESLHGAGVKVQWEKVNAEGLTANAAKALGTLPSCLDGTYRKRPPAWKRGSAAWRGHVRTAGFNLASALLTYFPGDSVGDICEYPGRGFDGYGVELGAPQGERSTAGALAVRAFELGYVAVNPSNSPAVLTLPNGRTGVDVATRARTKPAAASTFTLPPRTAVIARYQ